MSILKKLESETYRAAEFRQNAREHSLEDVVESVREKVLETHHELVVSARMSRDKRDEMVALVSELIVSEDLYVGKLTRKDLAERIVQEICGLGPIDEFLSDPLITEIMVNGPDEVYVERDGAIVQTPVRFRDHAHVLDLINRIVSSVGRRVDRSSPFVDARLPDGSRINAVIPPLALNGPVLTVRRFPRRYLSTAELVDLGSMPREIAGFLEACVSMRLDIVISGGSASGKTTTLNVLANSIDPAERIIVIEDSSEVRVQGHHVVYLETRPENLEGKGLVTIRDLLRNALRMRPDRIVIGECRGKETLDLISAMNTGHEGCLSTIHANSSKDCLERLCAMAMMSEEGVPLHVLRSWIASALDIVVHQTKGPGGSRLVEEVSLVGESAGEVIVYPVYTLEHGPLSGSPPSWFQAKIGQDRALRLFSLLTLSNKGEIQ